MNNHFSRIYYNDCGDGGTTPPTAGSGCWFVASWYRERLGYRRDGSNVWDNTGTEQGPPVGRMCRLAGNFNVGYGGSSTTTKPRATNITFTTNSFAFRNGPEPGTGRLRCSW